MIKKSLRKLKSYIQDMAVTYPREFDMYETTFEVNDQKVKKDDRSYSSRSIDVYFKGAHIAKAYIKEKEGKYSYNKFNGIKMVEGFESLRPEVVKVLYAASRKKYNQIIEENKKREALIKQAKVDTKFLGPF